MVRRKTSVKKNVVIKKVNVVLFFLVLIFFGFLMRQTKMSVVDTVFVEGESSSVLVRYFDFGFDPESITVSQGDLVVFNISSANGDKTFELPFYDVYDVMLFNGFRLVSFNASTKGSFTYSCGNNCKDSSGSPVVGVLIVK